MPDLLQTRRALRGLALRLVADPHAAEDVVQDAYVALVQRPGHASAPERWLPRVVRNLALRWRRTQGRRRAREQAVVEPAEAASGAALAAQVEMQRDLAGAVLGLPEPYRTTLLHRFWEDRSPSEIARAAGVPVATVKARLQRGLAQVRASLDTRYGSRARWRLALLPMLRPGGTLAAGSNAVAAWVVGVAGVCTLGVMAARWQATPGSATALAPVSAHGARGGGADGAATVTDTVASDAAPAQRATVDETFAGVVVQVLTADGTPAAGIALGMCGLYYEKTTTKWWETHRSLGRTDAAGIVRVEGVRLPDTGIDDAWWQSLAEPQVCVYVDEPGLLDVAGPRWTRADAGHGRCTLRLPATGKLRVVSTDAFGEPLPGVDPDLQLGERGGGPASREHPLRQGSWSRQCVAGVAVFETVGLGADLGVTCGRASVACPPLTQPGEERVVHVGEAAGVPILTGRLLGADGEVLCDTPFGVGARAGLHHFGGTGRTRADGSFAIAIGTPEIVGRELSALTLGALECGTPARVEGRLAARVYHLGDVVLRRPRHVVAGSIAGGGPSPQVNVAVERLEHVQYLDGTTADVWRRVEGVGCKHEGDRFVCTGEVAAGRLRVAASHSTQSFLPIVPLEFQQGANDVVLQMVKGAELVVPVAGDVPAGVLQAWLEPAPGVVPDFASGDAARLRCAAVEGVLRWPSLWPGRYALHARVSCDREPIASIAAVEVVAGDTTTLPALALPRPIRPMMLRVTDTAGTPLQRVVVVVQPGEGERARSVFAPEGELTLWTAMPAVDVVAIAAGRRALHAAVAADTTLRLPAATRRTLSVTGGKPDLPPNVELALELHASSTPAAVRHLDQLLQPAGAPLLCERKVTLDGNGEGVVELGQAGRYRITAVLLTQKTKSYYRVEIESAAVDLVLGEADFAIEGAVPVALPPAGLQHAIERVRQLLER